MSPNNTKKPVILAIDTSCDDTAAAVTCGWEIWSNVIASQTELHKPYGGVFPTVAKQAHRENIAPTVETALKRAQVDWTAIDAIAVTQGPGLAPSLEVGIAYARTLAQKHTLPLIPVNHLEGHLLSVWAHPRSKKTNSSDQPANIKSPQFPALGLLISGGHSEFIKVNAIGSYTRLGGTIDDAAGEALDKIGRMIGLGYPAGPVIEHYAKKGDPHTHQFPLPMTTSGDYNLSFSGLKTFSRNLITQLESASQLHDQAAVFNLAASAQYAIFRHITYKLTKILDDHPDIVQLWLGGGVAANVTLRKAIREVDRTIPLFVPYTKRLCQDNAAMIGVAGQFSLANAVSGDEGNKGFERVPNLKLMYAEH